MNNWYDDENRNNKYASNEGAGDTNRSDWYKPLNYDPDSEWSSFKPKNGKKGTAGTASSDSKTRAGRIAGLVIVVLALSVAVFFSRFGAPSFVITHFSTETDGTNSKTAQTDDGQNGSDSGFGSFQYDPSDETPEDYPDDFNEFFSSFYTTSESSETDVRIEKNEEKLTYAITLQQSGGTELSLKEIYEQCADSVVSIKGYIDDEVGYNWGTGVVLTADGLILTNTHVIDGCDSAEVITTSGETYQAKLVGADSISDLAVLKVQASGLLPAEFGESTELSVGDPVAAIGNPLGDTFSGTLTDGIISAIERNISYNGRNMTLLQTNTALNEGNSGGALFNMYGQVIGITNMKMMSSYSSIEGIGFAIPSSTVKMVVNSLIENGEVRGRPSIGITVGAIPTNVATHYDMPDGLYISAVSEGSDAEKQDVRSGDILTAVDGVPVTDADEVVAMKDKKAVGDTMTFSLWRNGEELEVTITLVDTNDIYS